MFAAVYFLRLTIYRAAHLTLSCYAVTFRISRRFEWSQSDQILVSQRSVHITWAEIPMLSAVRDSFSLSLSLSLTTTRPAAFSVLFGPSPYRMFSQKLYCPQRLLPVPLPEAPVLYDANLGSLYQVRVEKCVTKCGKNSQYRYFLSSCLLEYQQISHIYKQYT
jgi:hypothetical protein